MKDLENFFNNINRIANSLEAIAKKESNNLKATDASLEQHMPVDRGNTHSSKIPGFAHVPTPVTEPVPENIQPVSVVQIPNNVGPAPVAVPVSNEVPTYTQDDLARAMGRAIDDMGKMTDIQNIVSSFGAQSLMEIPQEKYPELVQKLKAIGVEV